MTTARDITTLALQKARVTAVGEAPAAEDAAHALTALNNMMHGWELAGVDTEHTDLSDNDTFPLEDKFKRGTVFLLAAEISPEFEFPQNFDADDFMRQIQAAHLAIDSAAFDTSLLRMQSYYTQGSTRTSRNRG